MQKRILLLIIFMVLNLNIYSQVVIKDEIILGENNNPDEENFTIPFYGRVSGQVNVGFITLGRFQGVRIYAGGQTRIIECPCGTGCPYILGEWKIENLLQGTLVTVKIFEHCVGGQPVEADTRYSYNSETGVYTIEYWDTELLDWYAATTLKFIAQTPPGTCPNAGGNYCDSSSWVQVPDIELVPYSGDASAYINFRCNEDEDRYAFFSRYPSNPSNLYGLTSSDVIACYNQIGQTWQFNLNQNMKLYYVAALCKDKIDENNMRIIYSLESIDSIDMEDCSLALRSFNGHKKYPYNIGNGGFIIKEALLLHEDGHKEKFETFMNEYFFIWETEIEIFRRVCTSYADIFDARKGGLEMYKKAFEKCYKAFTDAHDKFLGPKGSSRRRHEEERVNNRPDMTELIDLYIKKLKDHCNIQ